MNNLFDGFGKYKDEIKVYFEELIKNSDSFIESQKEERIISDLKGDRAGLSGAIIDFRNFLYYNYKKLSENEFASILYSLKKNLKKIAVLPDEDRGVYGRFEIPNQVIYINPNAEDSEYLTGRERRKLFVAHEAGHIINNEWTEGFRDLLNDMCSKGLLMPEDARLIYAGCSLLDEITTQDRAEDFAYEISGKQRPSLKTYRINNIYDGEPFETNLDYYWELQEPAILFARTLRGIGKENNDEEALRILSRRALSPNFFTDINKEYREGGKSGEFIELLKYMGWLKRASYAKFRKDDKIYYEKAKIVFLKFKKEVEKMRNYRKPSSNDPRW